MNNLQLGTNSDVLQAASLTNIERFRVYTERQLDQITQLQALPEEQRFAMHVVANVLPFRVNQYVIDELIDWDNIPNDPIFQLTFPQPGMIMPLRDIEPIVFQILAYHVPGVLSCPAPATDTQALALSQGVVHQALMLTDNLVVRGVDIPGL